MYYLLFKEFLSHFLFFFTEFLNTFNAFNFFLKKKKLCSSIKSFIFLETVHSLRPMLSCFVWRVSATVARHRSVWGCQHPFIAGNYSFWVAVPHRPLSVSPGLVLVLFQASLSGLRVGVGGRGCVNAVAPGYCTNPWLPYILPTLCKSLHMRFSFKYLAWLCFLFLTVGPQSLYLNSTKDIY